MYMSVLLPDIILQVEAKGISTNAYGKFEDNGPQQEHVREPMDSVVAVITCMF